MKITGPPWQDKNYYNQERRRQAEFVRPPNTLKAKVGSGGLSDDVLDKAQALLETNAVDFLPLAEVYLSSLMDGVENARDARPDDEDNEAIIAGMLYPGIQLKANGGMFRYDLVTQAADRLVQFLEAIIEPDPDALEIVLAFHTTLRAILTGRVQGDGGQHGGALMKALDEACLRYFDRYPYNRSSVNQAYIDNF